MCREISEVTRKILDFWEWKQLLGRDTKYQYHIQYEYIQTKIKESRLQDFKNWVGNGLTPDFIEVTVGKGDTKNVYDLVKVIAYKRDN